MMARLPATLAVLTAVALTSPVVAAAAKREQADVVLLGATGNLAGKYLWRAMLNLHLVNMHDTDITFYGAGRDVAEKGEPTVTNFLNTKISCADRPDLCTPEILDEFRSKVSYVQLKKREHFEALCAKLDQKDSSGPRSKGRLFYLSIPPFAYADIAQTIKEVCTPKDPQAFLRLAFEKPFGEDLESAKQMAASLAQSLDEEQIYRFDHYLGKIGVQQILDFRKANPELDKLMTSEHVASVAVSMTETEDCAGRSGFYDKYGVMRDIHQNHLMEVLVLATMDLEGVDSPTSALHAKAKLIASIDQVSKQDSMIGQYSGYIQHVQEDLGKTDFVSKTPTFAFAKLNLKNLRWGKTQFVMVAGKQLDQRQAEVDISFRDGGKIVFHIQGGTPKTGPTTYIKAKGSVLGGINFVLPDPNNWQLDPKDSRVANGEFDIAYSVGPGPDLPYNRLVAAMFAGEQSEFVGTEGLLESWRVWDKVIAETKDVAPRIYEGSPSFKNLLLDMIKETLPGHSKDDL